MVGISDSSIALQVSSKERCEGGRENHTPNRPPYGGIVDEARNGAIAEVKDKKIRSSGLILSAIRSILLLDASKPGASIGTIEDVVSAVEPHRKGKRMKNTFVILWAPGPAWVAGKTVRNQPYWEQHAVFMDRLFENGTVVLGGPFADATGSLVIVEAENEDEVANLIANDPFVVHGIFVLRSLKQWLLFLDARRQEL